MPPHFSTYATPQIIRVLRCSEVVACVFLAEAVSAFMSQFYLPFAALGWECCDLSNHLTLLTTLHLQGYKFMHIHCALILISTCTLIYTNTLIPPPIHSYKNITNG
ncbi:hypothetical protein AMECASPLE_014715 [Ameca splendens]|uniref:Uncharacterized protein n=1 Tax=Ameca splendens TaxID=208324 RepID=A0ABV0ZNB5_9TELE